MHRRHQGLIDYAVIAGLVALGLLLVASQFRAAITQPRAQTAPAATATPSKAR